MKVVLTVANTQLWKELTEGLEGYITENDFGEETFVNDTVVMANVCTIAYLADIFKNTSVNTVVVFYQQAEQYLAEAVNQGEQLSHAAQEWQCRINGLLELQRKNRARFKLINIDQAIAAPEIYSKELASLHVSATLSLNEPAEQGLAFLAACQYVVQSPELTQLNLLLHASSLPMQADNRIVVDVEHILSENDKSLILSQLHVVQEELEQSLKNNQTLTQQKAALEQSHQKQITELTAKYQESEQATSRLQQQLLDLQSQLDNSTQDHKKRQQELISSNDENNLLQEQLFHVQEELEKLLNNNQTLTQQKAALEQSHQKQITELRAKYQESEQATSRSQQQLRDLQTQLDSVTKEYKAAQQKLEQSTNTHQALKQEHIALEQKCSSTQQKLESSNEENNLLLEQLFCVQEALEQSYLDLHEIDNRYKEEQEQSQRNKVELVHGLAAAQADLTAVTTSKLWKSVAPVRKLSSALRMKSRASRQLKKDAALITTSEYFDWTWYLQSYPDVLESGMDPAEHYLLFGADEGRSPSSIFNGAWYLSEYPDVAESNMNPLLHYVKFGAEEGRTATPKYLPHLTSSLSPTISGNAYKKKGNKNKVGK